MAQSKESLIRELFALRKKDEDAAIKKRLDTVSLKFKVTLLLI